jgi:hypothetical protein
MRQERATSSVRSRAEDSIQQEMFMWYKNTYCLKHHVPRRMIFSVPNEGKPELVRTGLYPGASDLIIIHYPHPPIFVEVKTPTGIQKPEQKEFQQHIESLGYKYFLVRTLEEFQAVIDGLEAERPDIW